MKRARRVLGHAKMDTTTGFYAGVNTRAAYKLYGSLLDGARKKARQKGQDVMSAGTQSVPLALKFEDWPEQDVHAWMQARGKTSRSTMMALSRSGRTTTGASRQHYGHWLDI